MSTAITLCRIILYTQLGFDPKKKKNCKIENITCYDDDTSFYIFRVVSSSGKIFARRVGVNRRSTAWRQWKTIHHLRFCKTMRVQKKKTISENIINDSFFNLILSFVRSRGLVREYIIMFYKN